jgi:hypothetical protein
MNEMNATASSVKSLSRVRAHDRCPRCGQAKLRRTSKPQNTGVSMNGESLWELTEACTMCAWSKLVANVKIGV